MRPFDGRPYELLVEGVRKENRVKVLVVTSTPNAEGLTAACGESARQGVVDGGSRARVISLNESKIERCAICGNGWGVCLSEHRCSLNDDFAELHKMFEAAEAFAWITPVYFGQPSETFKAFFDRLRRCEATRAEKKDSILAGKPVVVVAAAGGSGGGAVQCVAEMEKLVKQLGAAAFDLIPVTQKTREYQLETIHDALSAMCSKPEEKKQAHPLSARKRSRPRRGRRNARGESKKN